MSQQQQPQWYQPGSIVESIRRAGEYDAITTELIVDVLATNELDVPRERIASLVETVRTQLAEDTATTEPAVDTDSLRDSSARIVSASDMAYLSAHDFARILGATLTRYEGTFQTPQAVDDCDVDLFWNRQHTTVAIKTAPTQPETARGEDIVHTVVEGNTTPATGRSASTIVIVSNTSFTDAAHDLAATHEITLIEQPTLDQWFTDNQLTHEVLGTILEYRDLTGEEYNDILDGLSPLPFDVQDVDPLEQQPTRIEAPATTLDRDFTAETTPTTDGPDTASGGHSSEADSAPDDDDVGSALNTAPDERGEHGVLYADPSEDGDADAFDRFTDELTEDSE
ncbi:MULTISPECIES: restriction endonuclease [Halobacterium]|uniref:restriction endonuclease n=1 Tax=Halobacterium TaxID=2239 RepID=UPI00073E69CA|nr:MULTISPECIES: restriction endonuclease [Halobacterium]MCG1004726.1 restriction endonuclease [Halobacterium noricense]